MLQKEFLQHADFDYWNALSDRNPEAFEVRRKACIDALISSAPDSQQQRLRGIQWQIDLKRKSAKTPMAACMHISSMMWDRVLGEGGLLESLQRSSDGTLFNELPEEEVASAVVIPFTSPPKTN
ncbi:MAG: DUF3135 domain-containing protein [Candidatus Polarisedimenticolaceae bacterium]|nr:DUF3135 domain-containing protein [Candidatus Polarisedimenticolaceae bacterium]